jgi:subtilisin family serine protease
MTRRRFLGLTMVLVALLAAAAGAQSSSGRIHDIGVVGLVPFEVTFQFTNHGDDSMVVASGTLGLMDQLGQPIERIPIEGFSIEPQESVEIDVRSRWEFQETGIFLVDVALDLGGGVLVSNSLGFRILPVRLPLAPPPVAEGEGLFTVYQQPVSWGLTRVKAPESWEITHGSESVVVAVIDSGIDWGVKQLAGSLWVNPGEIAGNGIDDDRNGYVDDIHGWDFRDDDSGPLTGSPIHPHGTSVASIIAAQPGELPIVGVAPGVRLMDVRFLDSSNGFAPNDWDAFVDAVRYAVDNGADIINMSIFSNGRPPKRFEQALEDAVARGVIIVGIAGNQGNAQRGQAVAEVMYPGRLDEVLAVSATTDGDLLASFSNRGPGVAFCAPGEGITTLTKGGTAATQSGTSFAAPHVSGVLALMLSVNRSLSPAEAVRILEETATDLGTSGKDDMYGNGLVNALEAVREAQR